VKSGLRTSRGLQQVPFLSFSVKSQYTNQRFPNPNIGCKHGKATLKKVRAFARATQQQEQLGEDQPSIFVFCEKATGVAQFRAQTYVGSGSTLDRIAGLFAMQCLVRGEEPEDFAVLVPANSALAGNLISRTKDFLEEGRQASNPKSLSPRQKEILRSVLCNRANKEIASKLNITVRTVKFHISSLLSKFGVENRTELARKAAGLLRPVSHESPILERPVVENDRRGMGPLIIGQAEIKTRAARFPGRILTA
jgi:DNA-binding CsgD family transcriptional regulator